MSADESSDQGVTDATNWSSLSQAMRAVQSTLGRKAAEQLAAITDHDPRTAQRFFSSERVPNGNAVYAMVRHPTTAPAFIAQATSDLPTADYLEYWMGMAEVMGKAFARVRAEYQAVR